MVKRFTPWMQKLYAGHMWIRLEDGSSEPIHYNGSTAYYKHDDGLVELEESRKTVHRLGFSPHGPWEDYTVGESRAVHTLDTNQLDVLIGNHVRLRIRRRGEGKRQDSIREGCIRRSIEEGYHILYAGGSEGLERLELCDGESAVMLTEEFGKKRVKLDLTD